MPVRGWGGHYRGAMLTGPQVCREAGITYRQLDYWCRTGMLRPARGARGSGTRRLFDAVDVACLRLAARLMGLGASTQTVGPLLEHWRERPLADWRGWLVLDARGEWTLDGPVVGAAWVVDLAACAGQLALVAV